MSLAELETHWSFDDYADAHLALRAIADAEAEARRKAREDQ